MKKLRIIFMVTNRTMGWIKRTIRTVVPILYLTLWPACIEVAGQDSAFTFVQMTDTQLGIGGYGHDSASLVQAVQKINAIKPDFVVICGDLVNKADNKSYSDFKSIISGLSVLCYLAPGNHDIGYDTAVSMTESIDFYRKTIGRDYYTFSHKDYSFVVTNSTLWVKPLNGETNKHDEWLKSTLEEINREQKPFFIIAHHQLFNDNPMEQTAMSPINYNKRTELLDLFDNGRFIGYLSGHAHRTIIKQYEDAQLLSSETTSVNFDQGPLGFRLWHVATDTVYNEFIPLK